MNPCAHHIIFLSPISNLPSSSLIPYPSSLIPTYPLYTSPQSPHSIPPPTPDSAESSPSRLLIPPCSAPTLDAAAIPTLYIPQTAGQAQSPPCAASPRRESPTSTHETRTACCAAPPSVQSSC